MFLLLLEYLHFLGAMLTVEAAHECSHQEFRYGQMPQKPEPEHLKMKWLKNGC